MSARLDWLKRDRRRLCPNHGGVIADRLCKITAWCPRCEKVWKLKRSLLSWRYLWWYEGDLKRQPDPSRL